MYDPRIARMLSLDPWTDKYAWQSPYVYHRNSPIASIDWKGFGDPPSTHEIKKGDTYSALAQGSDGAYSVDDLKKWNPGVNHKKLKIGSMVNTSNPNAKKNATFFSAGAGHDEGNTGYIEKTIEDMGTSGISNPIDIDAHRGGKADGLFATGEFSINPYNDINLNNIPYATMGAKASPLNEHRYVLNGRVSSTISQIQNNIATNNIDGQVNLIGYSTGSVIMAQSALYLANEKGIKIDNLILIGSAISNSSPLMQQLLKSENIGSVHRVDIPGDNSAQGLASVPSFIWQGDDHPHFKYAFNKNAHANRLKLFKEIVNKGIK
jgi:LysM repeat protein